MTVPIKRDTQISITPTPEELAETFCSMGSDEQAAFFNHLNEISADRLCFQLQAVIGEPGLTHGGRYAMQLFGDYGEDLP
ncbi:hypothetical protein H0A71_06365 [Alcaligenaceae bacterium]|nr:hypothetical protein [Alcaligenaceae bacterium]